MVDIQFIHADGRAQVLAVSEGMSLMHAATTGGIDGIIGQCGGSAMCATCHVYLDERHADRVPAMDEVENEMLDSITAERRSSSRLGCQIVVTPDLDGLVVHLPDSQE